MMCSIILFYFYNWMTQKKGTQLKDFQIQGRLGEGAFAQVFKVKRKEDGLVYAMKKIKLARIKDKQRNNALNQVRILASESGDNVIDYKEAFFDQVTNTLCIVMEYAQGGDLLKMIQTHAKKHMKVPQTQIWKALVHVSQGLKSLHHRKILHRDLKCANIFITGEGVYKLGDLNVSKVLKHDLAKTQTGTPYYASPQVWKDKPYGTKSDMWSLGCILYEMAAQKPPFVANDIQGLFKKICNGSFYRIPPEYSNDLAKIIGLLLKLEPHDRPSADELLNNPIVECHYTGKWSTNSFSKRDELLQTLKMNHRNFKSINEILPKPKYDKIIREKSYSEHQSCALSGLFKQDKILMKLQSSDVVKKDRIRVNSAIEPPHISKLLEAAQLKQGKEANRRERIISAFNPVIAIQPNFITNLMDQISDSKMFVKLDVNINRVTSRTPEQCSNLKIIQHNRSILAGQKIQSKYTPTASRIKIKSIVDSASLPPKKQNKQNLRRAGQRIIGNTRVQHTKQISTNEPQKVIYPSWWMQ